MPSIVYEDLEYLENAIAANIWISELVQEKNGEMYASMETQKFN